MRFHSLNHRRSGFTLAEVLIAIVVAVIFGVAAFATNARLMISLKTQRETTAASMMLQERMEALRSLSYTGLASTSASASASPSPSPPTYTADVVADTTVSEAQLGGGINGTLTETITVSGYMDTAGNSPPTTAGSSQWVRNAANPTGNLASSAANMASNYDLLQVDVQLSWTSANGRTRKREMTAIFGKGNKGS
jgi:prepilin-type N-terminal cleavage/methylation domain-containing protein